MGEALVGWLCAAVVFAIFLGLIVWVVKILRLSVAAERNLAHQRQRLAERYERAAEELEQEPDEDTVRSADTANDAASAEEIIRRVIGRPPGPDDGPPDGPPRLRLILGGPDAQPPPDLGNDAAEPPPPPPELPTDGPPFPAGRYRLELPDPDGPRLTMWQRNYVRAALMKVGAEMNGKTLRELTVAEAEAIVAAMGGKPWKLYTGGRAWGQKRYR